MGRNATTFKPGQVTNPKGRKPLPEDLRKLISDTSEQMKRDICEVYGMSLRAVLDSKDVDQSSITAGRAALISCVNNSFQTGDFKAIHYILDRILGKIPEALPEEVDVGKSAINNDLIKDLVKLAIQNKK